MAEAALMQALASRTRELEEAEERLRVCEGKRARLTSELELLRGAQSSAGASDAVPCAWGGWAVMGGRDTMEDAWAARELLPPLPGSRALLLAVFDGHGGSEAADLCAQRLPLNLAADAAALAARPAAVFREAFEALHREVLAAYPHKPSVGTAAVAALHLRPAAGPPRLIVANVGDCQAVLGRDGGASPLVLSELHRPSNEAEAEAVRARGGRVDEFGYVREGRGQGEEDGGEGPCLGLTRAIGDADLASVLSREAHVAEVELRPDDAFLLLGSDGVFDALPPAAAADVAAELLRAAGRPSEGASGAAAVACAALCRHAAGALSGPEDNAAAALLHLGPVC